MSTAGFMEIDEFMTDYVSYQNEDELLSQRRPNYEALLQTVTNLGKMIDKADSKKYTSTETNPDDLTADLFFNMSDSEMLSHFMPVRGIDYDQNYMSADDPLKKDKDNVISRDSGSDEFLPHQMIHNPLCASPIYQMNSAFKAVIPTKKQSVITVANMERNKSNIPRKEAPKQTVQVVKNSYIRASKVTCTEEPQQLPRPIKRRKPRTYRYNPKPLQHKESRSFVPDGMKDIDYWERRKRNNEAAKKSREERRKKELEIMNSYEMMKNEYSQIKIENIRLKARNSVLEKQVDDLKKKLHTSSPAVS